MEVSRAAMDSRQCSGVNRKGRWVCGANWTDSDVFRVEMLLQSGNLQNEVQLSAWSRPERATDSAHPVRPQKNLGFRKNTPGICTLAHRSQLHAFLCQVSGMRPILSPVSTARQLMTDLVSWGSAEWRLGTGVWGLGPGDV